MTSNKKPPGHIHKIREFDLEKIHLADEFDILQIVGEGWFGKILLVEHRATDTEMVLKALPKPYVSLTDFYREFHYGLHLGLHKNIVTTYDVAFETAGFYVFTQEYAPLGDLTSNMSESGIGELHSKRVAKQIALALDYIHSKDIVHRDVKLDNVLIYRSDFSRVKLCDFGESFRSGTTVERRNEWLPYSPPEVLEIKPEDTYKADPSHDIWQFGIVIFVCLTGCLPWQKAAGDDPRYLRYLSWHSINVMLPLRRTPKLFKLLSSKAAKMFRRFLEPKQDRRPKTLSDVWKFIDDRWLAKGAEKDLAENEQDELCPSMYSFHSCPEEKNKLLSTLAEHGIETTVDRTSKKARIRDWIESSVITEQDEDEDSGTTTPSSSVSREPVAGHISSIKAEEAIKKINTTLKDASNKHFDPRTGAVQQGPSSMGAIFNKSSSVSNIQSSLNSASSSTAAITNGKNINSDSSSLITLSSRNDLIKSEEQYHHHHSEFSLNMMGPITDQMVNSYPNTPSSNSIQRFTNFNQNNFKNDSTATMNFTNNNSQNNNNSNNGLDYRNFDNSNRKYFSLLTLNTNNITSDDNYNFNNIQLRNLNNNTTTTTTNKQSIATNLVSEIDKQNYMRAKNENSQKKSSINNANSIKSTNIQKSYSEEKMESENQKYQNRKVNRTTSNTQFSTPSSMRIDKDQTKISPNRKELVSAATINTGNIHKIYHQTMKDTPYDYIKPKSNHSNN